MAGKQDSERGRDLMGSIALVMNWDAAYDGVAAVVVENRRSYAAKHGHQLIESHFPGAWGKLDAMLESWGKADWLWWLDTDAAITNMQIAVEHLIDGNSLVIVSCDINGLNSGSMLIRTDDRVRVIMEDLRTRRSDFNWGPWHEQVGLACLFWKIWNHVKIVDQRILNSYPEQYATGDSRKWKHGDFVIHAAGISVQERISVLQHACQIAIE